ncbi:excinuclease ABC subunit UvrC [candidate division TA06 bacterium]|nr:excinuclease ABC subunit UvrC [candidate division TA06 bacterium]
MNSKLSKLVSKSPQGPGVYKFLDDGGRVLYVGKAKSLAKRIPTYFHPSESFHPRTRLLVSKVQDIEYIPTQTDVEALILEANMIKLHQPRYNVRLKDDKKYPYIKVTVQEDFPRVFPTRNLKKDGSIFFGPYTSVKVMKKALKAVTKIFPLRSCHEMPGQVCLEYHIKRCYGPCIGEISKEEYRKMVNDLCDFLAGKSAKVEKELEERMLKASKNEDFEEAARIRDQLAAVRETVRKQRVVFSDERDRDILALSLSESISSSCLALLQIRDGKLISRENYFLKGGADEEEVFRTFIGQYYKNAYFIPDEIIVPVKFRDCEDFELWFSERKGRRVEITLPQRGEKKRLLEMAKRNADLLLKEKRFKRGEKLIPDSVLELQRSLHLKSLPCWIEAFDVSNIQGSHAVGSVVVFVDGRPRKSQYRRFRIKTIQGIDDFGMMKEIVGRRFDRILKENQRVPDFVLIDGGRGHLNKAIEALEERGFNALPAYGLAKRMDELHLPDGRVVMLPKTSSSLRLLQHLRDEAHRFAITYHRKLRGKEAKISILDGIPGMGEVKRREIYKYFQTMKRLESASAEEIARVKGIGEKLARTILNTLHGED